MARGVWAEALEQLDRVFLWLPVAFGLGAAAYLGLKTEPSLWPGFVAAVVLTVAAVAVARWSHGKALRAAAILAAAVAVGFTVAKVRSDRVAAPVAPDGLGVVQIQGYVVDIDNPSPRGPRLLIAPSSVSHIDPDRLPLRVRIVMPPGDLPMPGTAVQVLALLDPPPAPAAPGAYDFARDAWFNGDGGVGLARGPSTPIVLPPASWRLKLQMGINAFRWSVADRLAADVNQALGGQGGDAVGLAVAVTTSHQDWLSEAAREDLRGSGLAHMLAIAGLHTAALSGFVFFALRLLIAAWPWLAVCVPGKKVAAAGGLMAVLTYLVLSGAHPPARRAATTASVAFIAILLDRRAISLRSLAFAALIVLVTEPEVVVAPGFEMSFCATASLVALAEVWPHRQPTAGLPRVLAWLQKGRDWLFALFMVSLVAGAATGPFAIQHFNRIANFGVFANLTADFVASAIMMPALAVALLLELIGHAAATPVLFVAGWAARTVIWIAHVFATAPGAAMTAPAKPEIALTISYLGILFACLWKGHLRWLGLPLSLAVLVWPRPPQPLIWIAADGADAAIVAHGQEVALRPGVRAYATDTWAQRRGLIKPKDMAQARGALFDCDYWSCVARPGVSPALGLWWTRRKPKPERLGELCDRADILVLRADLTPPPSCRGALVLGPADFARGGSAEVFGSGSGWRVVWAQPIRGNRPWTRSVE